MTESEVLAAVSELVARGEYRDDIPGIPGAQLSGPGCFRDGRRLYARGSPEYLQARAAGLTDRLPALTPAPAEAVEQAEALIGCALPSLLRRAYLEIGNGGFGPGYGVFGLLGGHHDSHRNTAPDLFRRAASDDDHHWRGPAATTLLPICEWGCGIYSFVDCASRDGRMWGWDPNPPPREELACALYAEDITLGGWLGRWVELRVNQPALVQDPPRGHGAAQPPSTPGGPPRWLKTEPNRQIGRRSGRPSRDRVGSGPHRSQARTRRADDAGAA